MNIELMKAKVLDLAIRGKLTEQRSDEALSPEVLQLPEVKGPFEIPENWKWCEVKSLGKTQTGSTPPKAHSEYYGCDYYFVKPADINDIRIIFRQKEISCAGASVARIALPGSVLMVCIGSLGDFGRCAVVNEATCFNQQINSVTPSADFDSRYIAFMMNSSYFRLSAVMASGQTTIPILKKSAWEKLMIPIPPLAEQRRIVQKAEELFKLIDALQEHQDSLLEKLDLIRRTALDKAIRGQLTEQRADETLSPEVLQLPELNGPFELPENWKWVKAGSLVNLISGTSYKKHDIVSADVPSAIRIIRGGNIQEGKIILKDDDVYVKPELASEDNVVKNDDIVIVASTGSKTAIGRAGIFYEHRQADKNVQIGAFLRIIRTKHIEYFGYLKYFYLTEYYRRLISSSVSGTNINNVKKTHIVDMLVPLPPLAEQERIAAKLESMFSAVSTVEQLLQNTAAEFDQDAA